MEEADINGLDDTLLMERIGGGDNTAFQVLVRRHYPMALRIAGRVLTLQEEAEDAVQEAFLKIWRMPDRFVPERGAFRSWLVRVVVNQCLDRRRTLRPVDSIETLAETADEGPTPEDAAADADRRRRLMAAMETLPPRQRAALALFYGEGMSMAEVADMMDLNVKAVESLLSRGRAGLRGALGLLAREAAE
ncbi:sigma-70 family RNA polymerase sigma factor [Pedomonas sp. V897]|uniref:sigma-70 family RNA polymerase sigma factor n=1 Tax=Pedomonas sp. V897 TaxID=3446482 RepID=UPI003EDFAF00